MAGEHGDGGESNLLELEGNRSRWQGGLVELEVVEGAAGLMEELGARLLEQTALVMEVEAEEEDLE